MTLSLIYFSFSIEKDCDKWYNNYVFEFSERSNRMNGIDTKEKLIGRIENVVYRNESNDYTVLEISDEKEFLVTVCSEFQDSVLNSKFLKVDHELHIII